MIKPDAVIHREPWWRSETWSVRVVKQGGGHAVNVLDLPPIVRDPLALADALASAQAWIDEHAEA